MADTKEKTLNPTSLDTLLDTIRLYVVPEFGMYQLNQIDSKMLQAHINYLAGRYSLRTVKKAYDTLNSSLSYALQLGYIENNPMPKVIKPTESGVAVKKKKVAFLDTEDFEALYQRKQKDKCPWISNKWFG